MDNMPSRMTVSKRSGSNGPAVTLWFVYICQAQTDKYYVGITNNPEARLKKHNLGLGSQFARDQGPFVLMYVSPAFTKSLARKREIQIKGWSRIKKEKLISGEWQ